MRAWTILFLAGCSAAESSPSTELAAPADKLAYRSDCSLTNPVARDPCEGTPASTRGLKSCAAMNVKQGQACTKHAPGCYLETTCRDGRKVVSGYLVCVDKTPSNCFTRSSRRYKHAIDYLEPGEVAALADQVRALPLARFRYDETGAQRLGFIVEDAAGAEFVSEDAVDLYALLAASIATLQHQEQRIQALEQKLERCADD